MHIGDAEGCGRQRFEAHVLEQPGATRVPGIGQQERRRALVQGAEGFCFGVLTGHRLILPLVRMDWLAVMIAIRPSKSTGPMNERGLVLYR